MNQNIIANNISAAIKEKGITEQNLADKLKVEATVVIAYELGVKYPTIEGLKTMCKELDKNPDELYTGMNRKPLILDGLTKDQKEVVRNLSKILKKREK